MKFFFLSKKKLLWWKTNGFMYFVFISRGTETFAKILGHFKQNSSGTVGRFLVFIFFH